MPSDLNKARDLFLHAVGKLPPEQWPAYVAEACAGNAELERQVRRLLQVHQEAGSFLEQPAIGPPATSDLAALALEAPGAIIGPYKLIQQIGEGGMGTVYMAQQTEPVKRAVALKIIKAGMDTRQVIARFEAERQALALMDHPNIAKVLDAGTTGEPDASARVGASLAFASGSGRPYFVMELVKGVSITKYCDEHRLTPRQRLELFIPVCQAVQHAHQKGIIHRDLKPSNILVAQYDGRPVPKVIDFGVAKAAGQQLTDKTLMTGFGSLIGTLEYMSPEQAEINQLDIDTRSDIYSLGVVLYELLTGSTPLDRKRLKQAVFTEMLRIIREEEPPKPSTRLSDSTDSLPSVSAQRHMEPAKLTRSMRGELDWIVMKALEKDRNRRYETANGFAADVQRYLNDEAVQACPPSVGYRLRKFARRNRVGLATAGVMTLMLLVALGGISIAVGWAVRDRAAVADQVAHDHAARQATLEGRISQALDEAEAQYEADKLPESISAVKRADALLASDSGVSNEIRQRAEQWRAELTILQRLEKLRFRPFGRQYRKTDAAYSQVFLDIGINIDAMPVEEAGRRIRSCLTWKRLTEALDWWAGVRHELAWLEKSTADGSRSLAHAVPELGFVDKIRLLQVARAADSDELRSQVRLAEEKWDLKAAERLAESPEVSRLPASTLSRLSMVVYYGGGESRRESAVRLLVKAQVERPGDFALSAACANFFSRMDPPRWAEAAHYMSISIAIRPEHADIRARLGVFYAMQAKFDEAFAHYSKAIELDPKLPDTWTNRGITYDKLGQLDKALADFSKAIELDPKSSTAWYNRGNTYTKLHQYEKAVADYSKAIELDPKLAMAWNNRGVVFQKLGQMDKALADHSKAIELDPKLAWAWNNRGNAYREFHQYEKALADFNKAIELEPRLAMAWCNRGLAYADLGQYEKAIADCSKAIELDPKSAQAWSHRGTAFGNAGQVDKALADFSKAIELDPKLAMAWSNRGGAHDELHQYEKAIADCSKAIELDAKNAQACNNRGSAYNALHQYEKAIADFSKAIELDPKLAMAWNNRGIAFGNAGQVDKALADFSKAIELDPKLAMAWNNRGIAFWNAGQVDKALADFSKAIELDSKNATWHNDLAWLLVTCPDPKLRDPSRAVGLAKRAVELAPKEGNHWNTLGVAHYRAGDWKAAIEGLSKSMELCKGGDSNDWFFLAMAHWKLGQKEQGRKWYEQAVEWMQKNQPQGEELRRFRTEAAALLEVKEKKKD